MRYDLQTFRGDLFGALTSTVVALPVALALGVASGMGAVASLHGAIAVGFFAAVFGGTRSQISGPTAPMTVAMTVILTTNTSNLTEGVDGGRARGPASDAPRAGEGRALRGFRRQFADLLVADSLTGTRHNPNRELVGQGIGTWSRGCWAACPAPAATMGTVVNIRAGGSTRLSGALRATFLLLLAVGLGPIVEPVPHAVLAAIMMKVGWDIIDWPLIVRVHRIATSTCSSAVDAGTDRVRRPRDGGGGRPDRRGNGACPAGWSGSSSTVWFPYRCSIACSSPRSRDRRLRIGIGARRPRGTQGDTHGGLLEQVVAVIGGDIKDHEVVIFDFSEAVHLDDSAAHGDAAALRGGLRGAD